ncbi:MAG: hypothetical protein K0S84_1471 [Nitrososphaera sp.]|jgi:hypothetical protein|nr:hypothetical protein [Nitrososphaera sp.]
MRAQTEISSANHIFIRGLLQVVIENDIQAIRAVDSSES